MEGLDKFQFLRKGSTQARDLLKFLQDNITVWYGLHVDKPSKIISAGEVSNEART